VDKDQDLASSKAMQIIPFLVTKLIKSLFLILLCVFYSTQVQTSVMYPHWRGFSYVSYYLSKYENLSRISSFLDTNMYLLLLQAP
jgi:hypothetical protein